MKIGEIKQIQKFIQEAVDIKSNPTEERTRKLFNDISAIYHKDFETTSFSFFGFAESSKQDIIDDLERIILVLNNKLNGIINISEIKKMQEYILKGKSLKSTDEAGIIKYIKDVILIFGDRIKINTEFRKEYSNIDTFISNLLLDFINDKNRIIEKLELGLEQVCCEEPKTKKQNSNSNTINNYISANSNAINNVNIDIQNSIESAKDNILTSTALNEEQTKEALGKIEEIASILNSKDCKKDKWSKIGKIVVWLSDKAVDVAVAFLPLIAKSII